MDIDPILHRLMRAWNDGDAPAWATEFTADAVQTMVLRDGKVLAFHNTVRTDFADFADDDEDLAAAGPMAWRHPDS